MSDSVRPHRRQPTRLLCPWDSPGKNTGVGCHFLLQYMKMKSESEVAQSCLTIRNPMDCSLPGSSTHGSFQARVAFLPRNKRLLISWLQSLSAVILEPKKIKSATVSTFYPSICHKVMGLYARILLFGMLSFKPDFSLSSFILIKRLISSLPSAFRMVSSAYLSLLIFLLAILIPACASSSPAFLCSYIPSITLTKF